MNFKWFKYCIWSIQKIVKEWDEMKLRIDSQHINVHVITNLVERLPIADVKIEVAKSKPLGSNHGCGQWLGELILSTCLINIYGFHFSLMCGKYHLD